MPARHVVGQHLPNGSTVTTVVFETLGDGTTIEEVHDSSGGGTISVVPIAGSPAANAQQLQQRLRDALVNNATYLSDAPDDQTQALTRQIDALIRVQLNKYETTKGT
jgi:hypothetical protein